MEAFCGFDLMLIFFVPIIAARSLKLLIKSFPHSVGSPPRWEDAPHLPLFPEPNQPQFRQKKLAVSECFAFTLSLSHPQLSHKLGWQVINLLYQWYPVNILHLHIYFLLKQSSHGSITRVSWCPAKIVQV